MAQPEVCIHHVTLNVGTPSREFYRTVLAELGLSESVDDHGRASFGDDGAFGIYDRSEEFFHRTHIAFVAPSREAVDRFHAAALAAGGTSIDPPRPRPEFDPDFYSTYVMDLGGNMLEALHRSPMRS